MGRSRGGLTTKIHALTDKNGLPIRLSITPGQAHDITAAGELLIGLSKGQTLLADKATNERSGRGCQYTQQIQSKNPLSF